VNELVVARNPEAGSTLPYVPLGERGLAFKARDTWPRTAAVYLPPHQRLAGRRRDGRAVAGALLRAPRRRRGPGPDARTREPLPVRIHHRPRPRGGVLGSRRALSNSPGPASAARPPAPGLAELEILVDIRERYPYRFGDQRITVARRALAAGDYAPTVAARIVACVERKSLADLVSSLTGNRLKYQLVDLAALPGGDRRGGPLRSGVQTRPHPPRHRRRRPRRAPDRLAGHSDRVHRHPALAEEWTYQWLAAAARHNLDDTYTTTNRHALRPRPRRRAPRRSEPGPAPPGSPQRGRLSADI